MIEFILIVVVLLLRRRCPRSAAPASGLGADGYDAVSRHACNVN
jgi:hypothetical protein